MTPPKLAAVVPNIYHVCGHRDFTPDVQHTYRERSRPYLWIHVVQKDSARIVGVNREGLKIIIKKNLIVVAF